MGSRGVYGFYKNGIDKITYQHGGSYPRELGESIIKFIMSATIEEMNNIFNKIIIVDEESSPTGKQIEECKQYFDSNIRNNNMDDWYCLLRKSQGTLIPYKDDLKYMIDSKDFIKSSLQCEWGYIINLDNNELEIYIGFQKEIDNNRYKVNESDSYGYYNCKLFKTIPFDRIDKNTMNDISTQYEIIRNNKKD